MTTYVKSALAAAVTAAFSAHNPFVYADENHTEVVTVIGQRIYTEQAKSLDTGEALAADLSDVLVTLPGVDVNSNGAATNILQYRGLFGDRVNVEIDGAPITGAGPNAMDSPLSHIIGQPGLSVNLYSGIAPVSAGAETLGGHVEVSTDTSVYYHDEGRVFSQLHAMMQNGGDVYHANGSLGFGTQDGYAVLSFTRQNATEMEDGEHRQIPNFRYDKTGGKVQFGLKRQYHGIDLSYQTLETEDAGTPALGMDIVYIDADWYRVNYQYTPNNETTFNVAVFGNQNEHGMDNVSQRSTMDPMARLNTVDAKSLGFELNMNTRLSWAEINAGFDINNEQHNSTITNPVLGNLTIANFNDVSRDHQSVFAEVSDQQHRLGWLIGARYTQIDSNAGNVGSSMAMMNPNVAALVDAFNQADRDLNHDMLDITVHTDYAFNEVLTGSFAIGQKTRAPSYTELYTWLPLTISAGLADGFTYLGNLDLDNETAHQIDVGLDWHLGDYTLSSSLFYQRIDDYIVGAPAMNQPAMMIAMMMGNRAPLQWQNVDATLWGGELSGQYRISDSLTLDMSANIVRGKRDDIDDNLFRMSPDTLRTQLHYSVNEYRITLESVLVREQTRTSALQSEPASPGYGLVNIAAHYQLSTEATISLQAKNLFDRAYQPHLAGINRVSDVAIAPGERLFAPGRQVALSFDYRFGL